MSPVILPPPSPRASQYVAEVLFESWPESEPTQVDQAPPTVRTPPKEEQP